MSDTPDDKCIATATARCHLGQPSGEEIKYPFEEMYQQDEDGCRLEDDMATCADCSVNRLD